MGGIGRSNLINRHGLMGVGYEKTRGEEMSFEKGLEYCEGLRIAEIFASIMFKTFFFKM